MVREMMGAGLILLGFTGVSVTAMAMDVVPDEAPTPVEAPAEARGATAYTLNSAKSALYVLVKYDRDAWIAGHDHIIFASKWTGSVTWDPSDISKCSVSIELPVSSMTVDPGNWRERAGLEGVTSDNDKTTIRDNFMSKTQLNGDKFPMISYKSTACEASGDKVKVTGNLTIRGVSKKVSANLKVEEDGTAFRARGSFNASHTDFGFEPHTAGLGALKNANGLKFSLDLKGAP